MPFFNVRFISFYIRFALSFDKIGGVSEIIIKKFLFYFVFRSTCTIFAPEFLLLVKGATHFCGKNISVC